jgi:hypothetical protein
VRTGSWSRLPRIDGRDLSRSPQACRLSKRDPTRCIVRNDRCSGMDRGCRCQPLTPGLVPLEGEEIGRARLSIDSAKVSGSTSRWGLLALLSVAFCSSSRRDGHHTV